MIPLLLMLLALAPTADELSEGERFFQGTWQLHSFVSGKHTATLRIEGRAFAADSVHGEYEGQIAVRPDAAPAEIDFTIRNCDCKLEGKTSAGIYREADGVVELVFPPPGEPRPVGFTDLDETKVMHDRASREETP